MWGARLACILSAHLQIMSLMNSIQTETHDDAIIATFPYYFNIVFSIFLSNSKRTEDLADDCKEAVRKGHRT